MTTKNTLIDIISRPVVRSILKHLATAAVGAIVVWLTNKGWLDAVGAQHLGDALNHLLNSGIEQVVQ